MPEVGVGMPVPGEEVARAVAASVRLALPGAARLGQLIPSVSGPTDRRVMVWAVAGLAADLLRARLTLPARGRLVAAVADAALGTLAVGVGDDEAHLAVVTAAMITSYETTLVSPACGLLEPLVVAGTLAATRVLVGSAVRPGQLTWLWLLATPGLQLALARRKHSQQALEHDEDIARLELGAATLDARAEVSITDYGLVHSLRDSARLLSAVVGSDLGAESAVRLRAAGNKGLGGSQFLRVVCRQARDEQLADRHYVADWLVAEPEDDAAFVRLDELQARALRAWLNDPDSPRGRYRLTASRDRHGHLTVADDAAGISLDLGSATAAVTPEWRFDPAATSLAVAAALLVPWIVTEPRWRERTLASACAASLAVTATVTQTHHLSRNQGGRRGLLTVGAVCSLACASLARLDRRESRGAPTAFMVRLQWPTYGLANLAAVWAGSMPRAEWAGVTTVVGASLARGWYGDGSDGRSRTRALIGFWPALAFTWRLKDTLDEIAVKHREERLKRIREVAAAAADTERDRILAEAWEVIEELHSRIEAARRVQLSTEHLELLDSSARLLDTAKHRWETLWTDGTTRSL